MKPLTPQDIRTRDKLLEEAWKHYAAIESVIAKYERFRKQIEEEVSGPARDLNDVVERLNEWLWEVGRGDLTLPDFEVDFWEAMVIHIMDDLRKVEEVG